MNIKERQLQLQNIIKTLQLKIHNLRNQLSSLETQRQENIYQAVNKQKILLAEKDKTIAFLQQELTTIKKQYDKEIENKRRQLQKMINHSLQEKSKNNVNNQSQIKQSQIFEQRSKEKQKEMQKWRKKYEEVQKQNKIYLEELQLMNKFYINCIYQMPDRQQTLLWVDKLIEFMSKMNNIVSNQSKERDTLSSNIVKFLKEELTRISSEYNKNQSGLLSQKNKFLTQIKGLINTGLLDYQEALKSNEIFWQNFQKTKQLQQKEQLKQLQNELRVKTDLFRSQKQQLQLSIQKLQRQNKTLILNCQQLKSLCQLKEKTLKEQNVFLKEQIKQLIVEADERQKQFEKQFKKIGLHIQAIIFKYKESPFQHLHQKVKEEFLKFQRFLEKMLNQKAVKNQIGHLQQNIIGYLMYVNQQKQFRQEIRQCVKYTHKLIDVIKHNISQDALHTTKSSIVEVHIPLQYSSLAINPIGDKSTQNQPRKDEKFNYELAIYKKQAEKLKEYCKQMQSKMKNKSKNTTHGQQTLALIQLSTENQLLQQKCNDYERQLKQLYNKYLTQSKILSGQKMKESKMNGINTKLLQKILQNSEYLVSFTRRQDQFLSRISSSIHQINTVMIHPIHHFQLLFNQLREITVKQQTDPSENKSLSVIPNMKESTEKQSNYLMERKNMYFQIVSRKNQHSNHLQRAYTDFSKTLRQLISNYNNKNLKKIPQETDTDRPKNQQSKYTLEKRIRQIQTIRVKNRQQMLSRLKNLQEKAKIIESKYTKRQAFPFHKFEENISKKVQEILQTYAIKNNFKDFSKISDFALIDIQSKLKQSMIENRGLLKQIQMLKRINLS